MKGKKRNFLIYFLEMLIVFTIIDFLMSIVAGGVASSSLFYKYGRDLIVEIFYSLTILIVMLLFKNSYVFTEKKEKFLSGIILAVPMVIVSLYNFAYSIFSLESFNIASFINMVIFCIFVGIAEEFLCRGWLQNEFLERFSNNKKEIIISILLSSFIFGFMHIVNISFQTTFETIIQIINATALGFLLGSVYYKTKNIWSVIFLHAFYDFSIMLGEINMVKDCTYTNPTLTISIFESVGIVIVSLLWVLGAIFVLNKCDFNNRKTNNSFLIIVMGFIFILLLIPFNRFIPNYNEYKVCYKYNEINEFDNYIEHYPIKKNYEIKGIKEDTSNDKILKIKEYKYNIYKNNNNKIVIKNISTNYERVMNYKDVLGFEVFESNDSFNIVIWTSKNESTLYVSNSIIKDNINDENAFIDNISFDEFVFPELDRIGYIDNKDDTYTYAVSKNKDKFVIINNELYIIK